MRNRVDIKKAILVELGKPHEVHPSTKELVSAVEDAYRAANRTPPATIEVMVRRAVASLRADGLVRKNLSYTAPGQDMHYRLAPQAIEFDWRFAIE